MCKLSGKPGFQHNAHCLWAVSSIETFLLTLIFLLDYDLMIVVIMILLTDVIRDLFYNLLTVPRTVSNGQGAIVCKNHTQHIGHSSCVACHVVGGDSSAIKFDRV